MYEFIKGNIIELTPTFVVCENNGMGFLLHITLNTFGKLKQGEESLLYIHQVVREDAHLFYGFKEKREREIFRLLISVSGVGANTARMILSSLSPEELVNAIATANIKQLQSIKGIGEKSAQRLVVELKDKIGKAFSGGEIFENSKSTSSREAISALIMLGFTKAQVEKTVDKIEKEKPGADVEEIIKTALRLL
ncbi:MAG TPA: Holliday junction branch migration protein RuvA [Flavobacterium sp.]|nr:Holliday junction branch migration protein RuvA [Flavobacterium sp.]